MGSWAGHGFQGLRPESFKKMWRLDMSWLHLWYQQFFYQKIQFHEVTLKNCLVLHAKRNVSGSSNKVSGIRQETWREDDPSFRKILEGGSSSRHMFSVFSLQAKSCWLLRQLPRNCRTAESQIPEITPTPDPSNDEDLTDTKVEPSSVTVAQENPGTPPAGMSMATTTRSGRTVREPQRLKDYVKYWIQSRLFLAFH